MALMDQMAATRKLEPEVEQKPKVILKKNDPDAPRPPILDIGRIRQEIANWRKLVADGRYKEARKNRHDLYVLVNKQVSNGHTRDELMMSRELVRELLLGESVEIPD